MPSRAAGNDPSAISRPMRRGSRVDATPASARPGRNELRRVSCLAVCACFVVLTGCAISPYKAVTTDPKSVLSTQCGRGGPSIVNAITAADAMSFRYHQMADRERTVRNLSTGAIIPLGAIAMYQGAAGGGTRASIAALGLTGAATYALAQNYTSSPREQVYLSGVKALTCLRRAYSVFEAAASNADLDTAIIAQKRAVGDLAEAIATAEGTKANNSDSSAKLAYARSVQTMASATLTDALRLQGGIQSLGANFCAAIEQVGANVAIEARKTDPTPESILASLQLLPQLETSITGRALPSAPAGSTTAPAAKGFDPNATPPPPDPLVVATARAAGSTAQLAAMVEASARPAQSTAYADECGIASVVATLSLSPDDSTVNLVAGETHSITINSKGIPAITPNSDAEGPIIYQLTVDSGKYVLQLTAKKATGTSPFTLTISDPGSSATRAIAITVGAAATEAGKVKSACAPKPGDDADIVNNGANVKVMQAKLGMPPSLQTGCVGDITRGNLKKYQKKNNLVENGNLTMSLWQSIVDEP